MLEKYPVQEQHEHGIVSAISSFNSLSANWYRNVKKLGGLDQNGFAIDNESNIIYRGIDMTHFQIVCKSIAQHNLYKCELGNERYHHYIEFGLKELLNPSIKIKIEDTLTYLLSIVDTIEFTKTICWNSDIQPSDVAKRIDIDFAYHRIAIHYSKLYEIVCNDIIDKYIKNIIELNKWLDIEVINREDDKTLFLVLSII